MAEASGGNDLPPKINPETGRGNLTILTKNEVERLFTNLRPAPSHSLQRPTPKFEDINRVDYDDFKRSATSKEEFYSLARKAIEGNYVLDLGAGRDYKAYKFAWHFGASGYIGIEADEEYASILRSSLPTETVGTGLPDPHVFVGDMVDALKRLPTNCGNVTIFMAGIDHIIDYTFEHDDYVDDLRNEIDRVLPIGGRVITYASIPLGKSFKHVGGVGLTEGEFEIREKQ